MEYEYEKILNTIITVILIIVILHIIFANTCPLYYDYVHKCKCNIKKILSNSKNNDHHIGVEKFNTQLNEEENHQAEYIEPKPYVPVISPTPLPTNKPLEISSNKIYTETETPSVRDALLTSINKLDQNNVTNYPNLILPNENTNIAQIISMENISIENIPTKQNIPLVNISSVNNPHEQKISMENYIPMEQNIPMEHNIPIKHNIPMEHHDIPMEHNNLYPHDNMLISHNNVPNPHNNINNIDLYEHINDQKPSSKNEIRVHSTVKPMDYLPRHAEINHDSKPLKINKKQMENVLFNDYISPTCCNNKIEHETIIKPNSESTPGTNFYDNSVGEYLRDTLIGSQNYCGDDKNTSNKWDYDLKKERDKFFGFNDFINQNSNPNNMAFRVQKLYNENNTDMSLSKIYDNAVKETNLYEKQCVKTPIYDNLTKTGAYVREGCTGDTFLNDNWMYNNDKIINGGQISKNLYPYDPSNNNEAIY